MDAAAKMKSTPSARTGKRPPAKFELRDAFAISHYDLRKAPHRPHRKFLDAVTIGHVLNKARIARNEKLLEEAGKALELTHRDLKDQVESITKEFSGDKLAPAAGAPPVQATTFDVPWDDRRYWLLVRMVLLLEEGNQKLSRLMNTGAIDHDEMKRRQRELARPFRAVLQKIVNLAAERAAKGSKE